MEEKVILISGGSDGLGLEMAKKLVWQNKVIILGRDQEKLNLATKEAKCQGLAVDISNFLGVQSVIRSIVKKYGRIDTLINNAGVWVGGEIDDSNPSEIKTVVEVNTLGTILLTREVVPIMKQAGKGEIINIISQDGLVGKPDRAVYVATKWSITGFTKSIQEELAPYGIKVSGVYPGLMKTGIFAKKESNRDMEMAMDPGSVAKLVEYLISLPVNIFVPEVGIKRLGS